MAKETWSVPDSSEDQNRAIRQGGYQALTGERRSLVASHRLPDS